VHSVRGFVFTLHSLQFVQAKNLVKFFWTSCKQEFSNQDASFNTRNVSITETSSQFSQSIFCLPFFQLGISALWNRTSSHCGNLRLLSPLLTFFTCYRRKKEKKKKKLHKQELATKDRHRQAEVTHTRSEWRNKRRAESGWLLRRRRAAISRC